MLLQISKMRDARLTYYSSGEIYAHNVRKVLSIVWIEVVYCGRLPKRVVVRLFVGNHVGLPRCAHFRSAQGSIVLTNSLCDIYAHNVRKSLSTVCVQCG